MGDLSDSFEYQLEFLKLEVDTINKTVERIDGITQAIKNWAVGVWAGSIALLLNVKRPDLIGLTVLLPLIFWFSDAWWRRTQRTFIYRSLKIAEFLNSDLLQESFRERRLIGLSLLDPRGWQYSHTEAYRRYTSVLRTMWFKSVGPFYLGLAIISVLAYVLAT
jgi:hypothetical protein